MKKGIEVIRPKSFESENHWYEKALNATIHPMVSYFLNLGKERIARRYSHMNPMVSYEDLMEILTYQPKYFYLAGADLFHVTTETGKRQMIIIENNSCPSGQKSMPLLNEFDDLGGYKKFIDGVIVPKIKQKHQGIYAVIYDKNYMEASGYAGALADAVKEQVYLIPYYHEEGRDEIIRLQEGYLEARIEGDWKRIKFAFRYLTQKPWNRLPITCKTPIFNPIITCLAGGRNKMMAAKAYDFYNAELAAKNLKIRIPETIWDVGKSEIPIWIEKMGGKGVIKIPYSNAGQGVFTIVDQKELEAFMEKEYPYDKFIVQSLVGNYNWSSTSEQGKFYHVGTVPDKQGDSYVVDFRFVLMGNKNGYSPLSIYSRRARLPLKAEIQSGTDSWDILGTNLSVKTGENEWGSETSRLMLMERKSFNKLGIGLDDMIDAYIQTVLSSIAIDKMAIRLIGTKGQLKKKLFKSLNEDESLIKEIMNTNISDETFTSLTV
ncbi:MAG: hypothetical protein MRY83_22135 [Flavobacteriales bacterium]|nr:hypothetical protein [Flavobacteriales bacterium]